MSFFLRKLGRLLGVVFAVSVLTFMMVSFLPGDVAYAIAGEDATLEEINHIREQLGLNDPILIRYWEWVTGCLSGDFGESIRTGEPVLDAIFSRLPVTIELMILSQIFAVLLAIPLGLYSAYRAGSPQDKSITTVGFVFVSIPNFVFGLIMIYFLSLKLDLFPVSDYTRIDEGLFANLHSMALPALAIASAEWVVLMRVLRSDLIGVLKEDYIAMARSKGLPPAYVLFRHALRPASFTLLTILGLQVANVMSGALVIETLFALPGLGRLLVENIFARDFMMVQGCVLFIAVFYTVINFTVDMLYAVVDPRVRLERRHG
ncbi:MAG: ABC transporter permease [Minwuia sp.]|uniref:ABC transporter permease n=1 Tax=Minwuia sp. TaxID=2493630 RepID=UPI003A8B2300